MSLTLVQRIVGGFVLLLIVLLISVVVNYNSVSRIGDNFTRISDETLPLAQKANASKILLLRQNQNLLSVFNVAEREAITPFVTKFTQLDQQLNELLTQIPPQVIKSNPALSQKIQAIQTIHQEYSEVGQKVMALHRDKLMIEQQINLHLKDTVQRERRLNYYLSKYSSSRYADPNFQITIKSLNREAKQVADAFNNYLVNHNIDQLKHNLQGADAILPKLYNQIRDYSEDKGKLFSLMLLPLIKELTAKDGLFQLYQRHANLIAEENKLLKESKNDVTKLLDNADAFVTEASELVTQAQNNTSTNISLIMRSFILVSLLSIVIAIITPAWIAVRIRQNIRQFKEALIQIAKGDMRVRFNQAGKDEFSELGGYLNGLVETLNTTFTSLNKNTDDLGHVAEKNAQVSETTTQSVNHQRTLLENTASAMTEMEGSVAEVAQRARDTMMAAEQADDQMKDVSGLIQQSIENIRQQATHIGKASDTAMELNEYGQKIDSIIVTIQTIAEQTNLLALNAAIEAARAGEQGRGFAVVADEVRSLASRTKDATQEIQNMIEIMQRLIKAVVEVISMNVERNESNIQVAETAGERLTMMSDSIGQIVEMNVQIASATDEQSTTAQEISASINNISHSAEGTAQGAQDNAETSQSLRDQARHQRELVAQFKL